MAVHRSFTEYVKQRFDSDFWVAAERYLDDKTESLDIKLKRIHCAGETEISDVKVEHVWVEDKPEMEIHFDVAISIWFQIQDGDHHYDDYEEHIVWIIAHCRGNLDKNLDDFQILSISQYNGKSRMQSPMDDSLVPIIAYEQLEDAATAFLKKNYPESLIIPINGESPNKVDPYRLAEKMGLTVRHQCIREDGSIFGQVYFESADIEIYDETLRSSVSTHIDGKTIVVDPHVYSLCNIGCINNTIVHECVHWEKHHKAFKLEQMFNTGASYISCEIFGGADSQISVKSAKYMEKQANQLAPRIQMPKGPFTVKAKEYISRFMRQNNASHAIDVMEMVIDELGQDFEVSRQAAKIRLVELGFEDAIGTFNYVDGHYVKPHGFRKGAIKLNQTFTLSVQDAAIQRLINKELREKTVSGDYLFVDNHYVYNSPLYVDYGEEGRLELTNYARAHMDECCLAFDMTITSDIEPIYHTICYLNRGHSHVTFEIKYHNGYQNEPKERQIALRKKQQEEWLDIRKRMTDDPEQCMELLLNWRKTNYTELGLLIDRDSKTISRTVKGTTTPTVETAALICFGLNLPPIISEKLLEVLGCKLMPMNPDHQWINEALHVKYPEPLSEIKKYLKQYGVEFKEKSKKN